MLALLIRFGMWLLGGLIAMVPTLIGQILIGLGIGVATYTGVDTSLTWLKSLALSYFTALPPTVLGMLSLMKVGVCISMVASAIAVRLGINGMTSGTFKRWIKK